MSSAEATRMLLEPDEPYPVIIERPDGRSPFVIVCDHAGAAIPTCLNNLGLTKNDLRRHIAWDIGAAEVARYLSASFDAPLVMQRYSRLVIDCNRSIDRPDSIPTISEDTVVPGNLNLSQAEVAKRVHDIFSPYHSTICKLLNDRISNNLENAIVSVHSFTPVYLGKTRPWHIGLVYNRDDRLVKALHIVLEDEEEIDANLCVGDNVPYPMTDEDDFTLPEHGEKRGFIHIMIEIRQDLLESPQSQIHWAERVHNWLTKAYERLKTNR